ncbi:hypothetical protein K388_06563 [Streptomyces sp. KhCrAH-43]|uniref:DUF2945 domain-containing protein n=1 Tax=unclassified Streptomyces TaxID=2593676 RepID=UPI00037854B9|nr:MULTISPECIES: DUF2945 domain-containing protein [unclassified Streptomyces]MYS34234.1 HVA1 family protein [Streptomyces sp. SID4920]MYX68602.1 HVA1 family protein [Streptomyces sp. SID8373]RAJ50852.1 hypothetical protein K388_06563 [Streptomyces sp. KhCrAH-43]
MAKKNDLSKGDKVSWQSHGQTVPGTVKKKITNRTKAAGRSVDASKEEPQFEVESEKSGKGAVHKPGSLRKRKS